MYICLCNNLTSKKVTDAIQKGVSETINIYSYYKCKPKCGKCIEFMNCFLKESNKNIYDNIRSS